MAVKHTFTSTIEDGADDTLVQPSDWNAEHVLSNALGAIDALTPAASKIPYFNGADSATLSDITATGVSLLGAANAAGARTTLELGTVATQAADNVSLTGGSISGMTSISGSTLTSTVVTGTAPLSVTSTTLVANLNTDTVDGFHASQTPGANQIPVLNSAGRLVLDGADDGSSKIQTGGVVKAGGLKLSDTNEIKWGDGSCKISGSGSTDIITLTGSQYISSNLGIGVTPSYPLHIKGTAATDQPTYSAEFLDASNWTSTGWAGSFATGWSHTTGNTNTLVHDHAAVSDTKYQIAYTVTGRTAGTFTISFGGQTSDVTAATGTWGPTATATDNLSITPTSDFNGTISISIKSITGISAPAIVGANSSGTVTFEAIVPNTPLNVFIGVGAGSSNTTGSDNIAIGYAALNYNTTGLCNVATGRAALHYNTTGSYNTANGRVALYYNTTGSYNIAIGHAALNYNTIGSYNVANGHAAGQFISGGSVANTTSSNSIYLGALTKASANGNTNEIVIGYGATGMGSNTAILGGSGITSTYLRGQVVIGATTSDGVNNLQVNGTIASKGIKLDGTASSDVNTLDYYKEGTFTATGTGFSNATPPSSTWYYVRAGKQVTISASLLSGTSDTTTFTVTGLPSELIPSITKICMIRIRDNGGELIYGLVQIGSGGTLTICKTPNGDAFTASGNKAIYPSEFTYML